MRGLGLWRQRAALEAALDRRRATRWLKRQEALAESDWAKMQEERGKIWLTVAGCVFLVFCVITLYIHLYMSLTMRVRR